MFYEAIKIHLINLISDGTTIENAQFNYGLIIKKTGEFKNIENNKQEQWKIRQLSDVWPMGGTTVECLNRLPLGWFRVSSSAIWCDAAKHGLSNAA